MEVEVEVQMEGLQGFDSFLTSHMLLNDSFRSNRSYIYFNKVVSFITH